MSAPGDLEAWAVRNFVSPVALAELRFLIGAVPEPVTEQGGSEARAQSQVRLEIAGRGRLWRNNVGVLFNEDGRPVRYGLANDSKALNTVIKSGDLIGWKRVTITAAMVGTVIAQFLSRECKPAGWKFNPNDPHEQAQAHWADLVTLDGGDACFATGEGTIL